jgi:hypothetical protein
VFDSVSGKCQGFLVFGHWFCPFFRALPDTLCPNKTIVPGGDSQRAAETPAAVLALWRAGSAAESVSFLLGLIQTRMQVHKLASQ